MKTELEKMRQGELAITTDPTIMDSILRAHRLVKQMNDEGFEVNEIHQYFKGICPACKQQNENQGN